MKITALIEQVNRTGDNSNQFAREMDKFISRANGRLNKLGSYLSSTVTTKYVEFRVLGELFRLGFPETFSKFALKKCDNPIRAGVTELFKEVEVSNLSLEVIIALQEVLPQQIEKFFRVNNIDPEEFFEPFLQAADSTKRRLIITKRKWEDYEARLAPGDPMSWLAGFGKSEEEAIADYIKNHSNVLGFTIEYRER